MSPIPFFQEHSYSNLIPLVPINLISEHLKSSAANSLYGKYKQWQYKEQEASYCVAFLYSADTSDDRQEFAQMPLIKICLIILKTVRVFIWRRPSSRKNYVQNSSTILFTF